jgi:hypothetical protein
MHKRCLKCKLMHHNVNGHVLDFSRLEAECEAGRVVFGYAGTGIWTTHWQVARLWPTVKEFFLYSS